MPKYYLSRDVYYCETDRGAIFIHLTSGKYFGLDLESFNVLRLSLEGWPRSSNEDVEQGSSPGDSSALLQAMRHRGLITLSPHLGKIPELVCAKVDDATPFSANHDEARPVRPSDVIRFLTSYLVVVVKLRLFGVPRCLRWLESRKRSLSDPAQPRNRDVLTHALGAFYTMRPWLYTAKDACALDSLTLVQFLTCYGLTPTFVIGVQTKPFLAHAWVQAGGLVLNDSADTVRRYTPILAV